MSVRAHLSAAFRVRPSSDLNDVALQNIEDGNTAMPPAVPAPP
jgi:hypothetical protein